MKKIRGHRRIWRKIEIWIENNKTLDINHLLSHQRDYTKIRIHPWSGINLTNSITRQPNKKTKQKILNGLFEIYDNWKSQLDKLGQPYYLKIWLYEQRFSNSQIVCAIGENIDFYKNTFSKFDLSKEIVLLNFGQNNRIDNYNWEPRIDEEFYDNTTLGLSEDYENIEEYLEMKKWFDNLLSKPHKNYKPENPTDDFFEIYAFEKGNVWLGEKK